eukprot:scaffold125751_cov26-Prasinocladus_malaysianus.AAC.1
MSRLAEVTPIKTLGCGCQSNGTKRLPRRTTHGRPGGAHVRVLCPCTPSLGWRLRQIPREQAGREARAFVCAGLFLLACRALLRITYEYCTELLRTFAADGPYETTSTSTRARNSHMHPVTGTSTSTS